MRVSLRKNFYPGPHTDVAHPLDSVIPWHLVDIDVLALDDCLAIVGEFDVVLGAVTVNQDTANGRENKPHALQTCRCTWYDL